MHPIVLLPDTLKTADTAVQRAVVAHELHHVKRRDWMWTIAEEIVRSVFWFHPAMWWLVSRVQLAREAVVDELSILTTNARRAYVDALLALADGSALSSSTAFSARRHLFHRVMLIAKEGGMSSVRIAAISGVLVAALGAGSWTAVSAFPLHGAANLQSPVPRDPHAPPRDPQTREAYQRQAEEYWERANRDLTLTPDEKIQTIFKGIEATDRALALDRDYVPSLVYKNIFLRMAANLSSDPAERERLLTQANELRDKAIALGGMGVSQPVDPAAPPPPPPPPPPGDSVMLFMPQSFSQHVNELNPVHIGNDIKAPIKVRDVRPVYPPIARESRVQGVVIIEALLDESGSVVDARVLRSIPLLDQAALDAVKQWQFMPVLLNGAPHAAVMTVTVNFTLQ
jgi:TonB family protein